MKKILSYVAFQRKLNIKVDLKNRGSQLDIYDFMEIEIVIPSYTSYKNQNGNCKMCAISDYMNILFYNGDAVYIPQPRTIDNTYLYNRLACFNGWDAHTSLNDFGCHSLQDVINKGENCICSVACKGGYHAIAFVDGLFYNNWNNRKGLTLEELKKDFGYTRTPKLIMITPNNKILALLEKALEYGLIKKC